MAVLNGINDQSITPPVVELEAIPFHLPLFYLQTPSGPEEPYLCMSGSDFKRVYGDDAIDKRGLYYNHATALALSIMDQGNACLVKRITRGLKVNGVETNAPAKGRMTLVATLDTTPAIHPYMRKPSGVVILNSSKLPTYDTATTVTGGVTLSLRWLALAEETEGTLESTILVGGNTAYPLLTVESTFVGDNAKNTGVRLWSNNAKSNDPADLDIVNDQNALIYSAQLVQRKYRSTPTILFDKYGADSIKFCFKPNAYNYKTSSDLTINKLVSNFSDSGIATGTSPKFGPLGKVIMHQNNISSLFTQLLAKEEAAMLEAGLTAADFPDDKYLLDIFTGVNFRGIHHYGFQVSTTIDAILRNKTQFLLGGNDGDLSNNTYELQIIEEINNNYQNPAYPLIDSAKYPFSCLYDSGFQITVDPTVNVKYALLNWLDYRKDVHVTLGTHVVGETQLTAEEEITVGTDLRNACHLHTESETWGTSTVRAVVMMQSGILLNSRFDAPVSTVFELAMKRARYAGAGNGILKHGFAYNVQPLSQIQFMRDLTNTFLTRDAKTAAWSAGLTYAQSMDRKTFFYPAMQTVYPEDNSVLSGEIFMQICCDITRQSELVWKLMSGNDTLTEAQFSEESDKLLLKQVAGRYDNRVTVVPNTYFTEADSARGYSWTQEVSVYGQVPRTVAQITLVTKRTVTAA